VDTTEEALTTGRRRRRHHSVFFKAEAVGACQQPGVSIAWRLPTKLSKHDYLRYLICLGEVICCYRA
jgi:hypothetical protein